MGLAKCEPPPSQFDLAVALARTAAEVKQRRRHGIRSSDLRSRCSRRHISSGCGALEMGNGDCMDLCAIQKHDVYGERMAFLPRMKNPATGGDDDERRRAAAVPGFRWWCASARSDATPLHLACK